MKVRLGEKSCWNRICNADFGGLDLNKVIQKPCVTIPDFDESNSTKVGTFLGLVAFDIAF